MSMDDDGRPPEITEGESVSWVAKVKESNGGGIPVPEKILADEFVTSRMRLEFPNGDEGEPVITIGQEVLEAMNGLYRQCMIVKVLGRHTSVESLSRKLRELWKPAGGMVVLDLPRQFFMVRFDAEADYMAAVTGGPWRVLGSILMVQAWAPNFDPLCDEIVTTPVWVRISHQPVNFYHRAILMGIAEGLGRPIKVDLTTLKMERARFARVCVEVNLKKPLKGSLLINGERYHVSYEGLNNICPGCGVYGHLMSACPKRSVVQQVTQPKRGETSQNKGVQDVDGFTEVRHRNGQVAATPLVFAAGGSGERKENTLMERVCVNDVVVQKTTNRFSGLEVEGETWDANKENENHESNQNVLRQERSEKQSDGRIVHRKEAWSKGGSRGVELERRLGGSKVWRNVGTKGKAVKQSVPARGFVYGPTRGETGGISSGKRLRVEEVSVGRDGGVFTAGMVGTESESRVLQSGEGEMRVIGTALTSTESDNPSLQESSMDAGLGNGVK